MKGEQFMNNNVLNHDFGYGNSTIFKDSDIKKLKIENICIDFLPACVSE